MNRLSFSPTCSSGGHVHACVCICCSSLWLRSFLGGGGVGMLLVGTEERHRIASCLPFTQCKEVLPLLASPLLYCLICTDH